MKIFKFLFLLFGFFEFAFAETQVQKFEDTLPKNLNSEAFIMDLYRVLDQDSLPAEQKDKMIQIVALGVADLETKKYNDVVLALIMDYRKTLGRRDHASLLLQAIHQESKTRVLEEEDSRHWAMRLIDGVAFAYLAVAGGKLAQGALSAGPQIKNTWQAFKIFTQNGFKNKNEQVVFQEKMVEFFQKAFSKSDFSSKTHLKTLSFGVVGGLGYSFWEQEYSRKRLNIERILLYTQKDILKQMSKTLIDYKKKLENLETQDAEQLQKNLEPILLQLPILEMEFAQIERTAPYWRSGKINSKLNSEDINLETISEDILTVKTRLEQIFSQSTLSQQSI